MLQTRRKDIYLHVLFVIIADSSGFKVKGVTQTVCHQAIEISRAPISADPISIAKIRDYSQSVVNRLRLFPMLLRAYGNEASWAILLL